MNYKLRGFGGNKKDKLKGLVPEYVLDRQDADYLIAIGASGKPLGILCYAISGVIAEILYVIVFPSARFQGVCSGLIRGFLDKLDELKLSLSTTVVWDEANDAVMGRIIREIPEFSVIKTPSFFRVSPEDIASSLFCSKVSSKEYNTKSWGDLSPNVKKKVYKRFFDMGFFPFVNQKEEFLPDLSTLFMEKDEAKAAVFIKSPEEKTLEISFIWSDATSQKSITAVLGTAIRKLSDKYSDYHVEFTGINHSILKQAELIFPGVKPEYIYSAIRFGNI